jgi:hypothetical protein
VEGDVCRAIEACQGRAAHVGAASPIRRGFALAHGALALLTLRRCRQGGSWRVSASGPSDRRSWGFNLELEPLPGEASFLDSSFYFSQLKDFPVFAYFPTVSVRQLKDFFYRINDVHLERRHTSQ